SVGARYAQDRPAGGIATAGKTPATGDAKTAGHRLSPGASRIEAARREGIRPTGEEFVLGLLGEVPDPPVMRRPQAVAPGGGAARTAQLIAYIEGRLIFDVQSAISRWVADANETGGDQILHRLGGDLPQLFGSGGALLQNRHQLQGPAPQLFSGQQCVSHR